MQHSSRKASIDTAVFSPTPAAAALLFPTCSIAYTVSSFSLCKPSFSSLQIACKMLQKSVELQFLTGCPDPPIITPTLQCFEKKGEKTCTALPRRKQRRAACIGRVQKARATFRAASTGTSLRATASRQYFQHTIEGWLSVGGRLWRGGRPSSLVLWEKGRPTAGSSRQPRDKRPRIVHV